MSEGIHEALPHPSCLSGPSALVGLETAADALLHLHGEPDTCAYGRVSSFPSARRGSDIASAASVPPALSEPPLVAEVADGSLAVCS